MEITCIHFDDSWKPRVLFWHVSKFITHVCILSGFAVDEPFRDIHAVRFFREIRICLEIPEKVWPRVVFKSHVEFKNYKHGFLNLPVRNLRIKRSRGGVSNSSGTDDTWNIFWKGVPTCCSILKHDFVKNENEVSDYILPVDFPASCDQSNIVLSLLFS